MTETEWRQAVLDRLDRIAHSLTHPASGEQPDVSGTPVSVPDQEQKPDTTTVDGR